MSLLQWIAARPELQKLGLTLLHFLWQGAALAALVALSIRTLRLRRGGERYRAYLVIMILMVACPVVTYCLIDSPPVLPASPNVASARGLNSPAGAIQLEQAPAPPMPAIERHDHVQVLLRRALPSVLVAWTAGVGILGGRLMLGVVAIRRWKRSAEKLPPTLRARASAVASRLGLDGFTGVYLSHLVRDAVAVGFWRPMVLLPAAMVSGMSTELLEAVIAHELAHIRRKDLWINFFQRLAETLLFYHPAIWWVSSRIREEREMCCDDVAVAATGKPIEYASALAEAGRLRLGRAGTLALGIHGGGRLLARVQRILGAAESRRHAGWPAGLLALAVVLLVTFLATLPRPATADDTAARKADPETPQSADETPAVDPRFDAEVEAALRQDVEFADCLKQLAQANREIVALHAAGVGDNHRDLIKAKRMARQIEEYLAQRRADMRVELDHRRNVAMSRDVDRYVEEQADKDALINALRQELANTEVQRIVSSPDGAKSQRLSAVAKLLADRLAQREDEIRKLAEARWRDRQKQSGNPISLTPPRQAATAPLPANQVARRRTDVEADLKELQIKLEIGQYEVMKRKALLQKAVDGRNSSEIHVAEAELKQAELELELMRLNLERAKRMMK
jgi:beta-lactamase regulating signal transducer with metallopeptidase domain